MKILLVGAELFHKDGRTDKLTACWTDRGTDSERKDEVNSLFSNFSNALTDVRMNSNLYC